MKQCRRLLVWTLVALCAVSQPAHAYSDARLIEGFQRTVFGSEYSGISFTGPYIRKFNGTVRFHIVSRMGSARKNRVARFVRSLDRLIYGLRTQVVARESDANFVVYIVPRRDYAATVRNEVYKGRSAIVRGRCMVRSVYSRKGIDHSAAVIVGDEGDDLFRRCMTEEILQGLGPLNDDATLRESMFNDTTRYTRFRRFDRILLNMLYDRRIKNGASRSDVAPILPVVVRDVQRRIARSG